RPAPPAAGYAQARLRSPAPQTASATDRPHGLPARWPWRQQFSEALERIRALPAPADHLSLPPTITHLPRPAPASPRLAENALSHPPPTPERPQLAASAATDTLHQTRRPPTPSPARPGHQIGGRGYPVS